jgi:hypothetical protein
VGVVSAGTDVAVDRRSVGAWVAVGGWLEPACVTAGAGSADSPPQATRNATANVSSERRVILLNFNGVRLLS